MEFNTNKRKFFCPEVDTATLVEALPYFYCDY